MLLDAVHYFLSKGQIDAVVVSYFMAGDNRCIVKRHSTGSFIIFVQRLGPKKVEDIPGI